MGSVYKHTNKIDGRVYIGETSRTGYIRYSEHLDPFNYQSGEMFYDMLTLGIDNFAHETLEDNIDTKAELLRSEAKWIQSHSSNDPRYGYNGGWKGEMYGCPTTAANFPPVSTLTKTCASFPVNASHIGKVVLYRWQHKHCTAREKKEDPTLIERIGILHAVRNARVAILPIAPLSRYPCEWVRIDDVLGLASEKYAEKKMQKIN
jgi:hypothetical protein